MWRPLSSTPPQECDLYIACHQLELLSFVPRPKRRVLWVMWPANQLRHYKKFWRMWLYRPIPVLVSHYQAKTWSRVLPRPNPLIVLPFGLPEDVRGHPPLANVPPPHAIFASNPTRNLRRLVEIWASSILPRVPGAVLDVYGVHQLKPGEDAWSSWEGKRVAAGHAGERQGVGARASVGKPGGSYCRHARVEGNALSGPQGGVLLHFCRRGAGARRAGGVRAGHGAARARDRRRHRVRAGGRDANLPSARWRS